MKHQTENTFEKTYEEIRQRFNNFAEQRGLTEQINSFLVSEIESGSFNPNPYIAHMAIDGAGLAAGALGKLSFDTNIIHTFADYHYDKQDHTLQAELENKRCAISENLMSTLALLGKPNNYYQALAQEKLVLNINGYYLDTRHYEEFKQYREKINLEKNHFAKTEVNLQLALIEGENKSLIEQQDRLMASLEEVKTTQRISLTSITNANKTIFKEHQVLVARLEAQNIDVSEHLLLVLQNNDKIKNDLTQVLGYLENDQNNKLIQVKSELKAANYQGLNDACHVTAEIGKIVNSKSLIAASGLAQAGIQMHRAYDQIMNSGLVGAAILNPYAAIGMALISIYSLFRKQPDTTKIMMKQLAKLSQQIATLHKEMNEKFFRVDERLSFIFIKIQESIENIRTAIDTSVVGRLSEIQSSLETLTRLTKIGFQEIILKDLKDTVGYVDELNKGILTIDLSKEEYKKDCENRLRQLKEFLLEKACSPLLNGNAYIHLLQGKEQNHKQLCSLLSNNELSHSEDLLGLLAHFAKHDLKISELASLNENKIFHPKLWILALQNYLELKAMYKKCHPYDPKEIVMKEIKEQLDNYFLLRKQLNSNQTLYNRLFDEILSHHQNLKNTIDIFQKRNNVTPANQATLSYEIPKDLRSHREDVTSTQAYFTKDRIEALLKDTKISIPNDFKLAEQLGIGYLEYKAHLPDGLHRKHHKHLGKYRCKEGEKVGMEINFILGGQKIVLFNPGYSKKSRFTTLEQMYSTFIKFYTKKCHSDKTVDQIQLILKNYGTEKKKSYAQTLLTNIQGKESYSRLLILNHLLFAYLRIAGFGTKHLQALSEKMLTDDITDMLEAYIRDPINRTMPNLQLTEANIIKEEFSHILYRMSDSHFLLDSSLETQAFQEISISFSDEKPSSIPMSTSTFFTAKTGKNSTGKDLRNTSQSKGSCPDYETSNQPVYNGMN